LEDAERRINLRHHNRLLGLIVTGAPSVNAIGYIWLYVTKR
jgi:hypothetical protein